MDLLVLLGIGVVVFCLLVVMFSANTKVLDRIQAEKAALDKLRALDHRDRCRAELAEWLHELETDPFPTPSASEAEVVAWGERRGEREFHDHPAA